MASLTLVDTGAVDHGGVGLPEALPRSEAARCAGKRTREMIDVGDVK